MQDRQLYPKLAGQAARVLQLKIGLEGGFHKVGPHVRPLPDRRAQQIRGVHAAGKGQRRFGVGLEKFVQVQRLLSFRLMVFCR